LIKNALHMQEQRRQQCSTITKGGATRGNKLTGKKAYKK